MTTKIASYAAKKLLNKEFGKYADKKVGAGYDPLFEMRPDRRGRQKKVKKQVASYIPEGDAVILAKVRKRAYRLDMALFELFGVRWGWSSVIGIVPEIGDVIALVMTLITFRLCCKIDGGLPNAIKMQMLVWTVVDFVSGLIPFAGDLLDASIKANVKMCKMLEEHLDAKYKPDAERERQREKRKSDPHYKPPAPATVYEDFDDERSSDRSPARIDNGERRADDRHAQPVPAADRHGRRQGDVEMGYSARDDAPARHTSEKRTEKKKGGSKWYGRQ